MGKKIKKPAFQVHKNRQQHHQSHQPNHTLDKHTLLALSSEEQLTYMKELLKEILADPQTHFKKIDSIFALSKTGNVQIAITAIRVLAEVFVGVAPLQSIDLKQMEERKGIKITKDQFKVIKFQELLVGQYQRYLKLVKEMSSKLTANDFAGDEELYLQFKKCLLQSLLKCFETLWNFNHFKLLSELIVYFLKYEEASRSVTDFLADKNISTFKAKARIIACIAALIKQKPQNSLPNDLVKIINNTYVDFRYLQKDVESLQFQKKKMTKKLYRQKALQKKKEGEMKELEKGSLQMKAKIKKEKTKQKLKVKEEVEKQFAEGQATLKKKELVKANSQVLQEIYYIYFKILVERPNSKFIPDVLEGILTYAHLINIDLTSTLITHLDSASQHCKLLWLQSKNQHLLEYRIRIAFTTESLLNGPLAVYNMDDLKATTALFGVMRDINENGVHLFKEHFRMLAISLEQSLLKRRQLSQEVVASLVRQMCRLLAKAEIPKLYLLELIRQIASRYSKISRMFEPDNEGYGLYGFNPHVLDPQATNAINTELVTFLQPLTTIKKLRPPEYCAKVCELSQRLLRQNFLRIQGIPSLEELLTQDLLNFK